jgi:protein TonB
MVSLRCLLFSSHPEMVQPIWQVLADLGIEGEYCQSAVDAVEKVTTQSFQIVITDWEDQPEAAFLLKTTRDLKAAQRPLTLAIVSDDARRPEALQAGANSILRKPIRVEQVRDTMSTACELLRSKLQMTASVPPRESSGTAALAATAATDSAPRMQFDQELAVKAPQGPAVPTIDAEEELPPIASALDSSVIDTSAELVKPKQTLTGWAMLQARLTQSMPSAAASVPARSELLTYGETRSYSSPSASSPSASSPSASSPSAVRPAEVDQVPGKKESRRDAESAATLFAYISGKSDQASEPAKARLNWSKIVLVTGLGIACLALGTAPKVRRSLQTLYRNGVLTGTHLLNPPPAPLPQSEAVHDSFGQSGDEYNLPVAVNIPDATTDPSQIRVLPMIDPTAKPQKTAEPTGEDPVLSIQNPPTDLDPDHAAPNQTTQEGSAGNDIKDTPPSSIGEAPGNPSDPRSEAPTRPAPSHLASQSAAPQLRVTAPLPRSVVQHTVSASVSAGIPSSLKSQLAPSTPQASGSKPVEAAMSSIEPVILPELVARQFVIQQVDPVYPAAAKASGQRGSVVLQLLIGRDGTVQDAKFLQGSLVFARVALDAVKQCRFKPYLMNGRPVSVQSLITLSFKPPV